MLSAETIEQAIVDLKEPIIFQGFQHDVEGENNPEFLRWELNKFVEIFGDAMLSFRTGDNARTHEPQWDINSPIESMRLSTFIDKTKSVDLSKWYYFDYKYMHQWLADRPDILKSINWNRFGFDKDGNDSTLWIGSKGSHTNCHQDTYGRNLVAQIHGRKQWILFPPDAGRAMRPTRVPYEESTIYSKWNFFCPTEKDLEGMARMGDGARLVELEPGDVLLVPNGWWHYVESLDTSVSVNIWLAVDDDYKGRLKEALVKLLVTKIGEGVPSTLDDELRYTRREFILLIEKARRQYNEFREISAKASPQKRAKKIPWTAKDLSNDYPSSVRLLTELKSEEFVRLLTEKRERFTDVETPPVPLRGNEKPEDEHFQRSLETIVDALCHFDVIDKVADFLLDDQR